MKKQNKTKNKKQNKTKKKNTTTTNNNNNNNNNNKTKPMKAKNIWAPYYTPLNGYRVFRHWPYYRFTSDTQR